MKRIITLAAASMIAAPAAFAAAHMAEEMTMVQSKVSEAISDCEFDVGDEDMMNLTMAQVSGIIISAGSDDENDKCDRIEALLQDDN